MESVYLILATNFSTLPLQVFAQNAELLAAQARKRDKVDKDW